MNVSAMDAEAPAQDAGAAPNGGFGNATGHVQPSQLMLFDDGGAGVLPDGAIVYLKLWARPCPVGSTLTYETFGRDFFQHYCLHCHSAQVGPDRTGAPEGVNFDTQDEIVSRKETIWGVAADENSLMPAAGAAPSMDERHELGDWLACGAP
jgi:hypothetical protein